MKKIVYLGKDHIPLSKQESVLLNAVEPLIVFSVAAASRAAGWDRKRSANVLAPLKRKGIVTSVKRDSYTLTGRIPENLHRIATAVSAPAYVGFWTAFSIYGFTQQHPATVQVVSTKQHPPLRIGGHLIETTTVMPERFFGYAMRNGFAIAEPEKLIIDSLCRPEKAGGMEELRTCIRNAWPEADQKKLLGYLGKFGSKALFARLGYLIEELPLESSISDALLRHLPKSYVPLDPRGSAAGGYNPRWMVMANDQPR